MKKFLFISLIGGVLVLLIAGVLIFSSQQNKTTKIDTSKTYKLLIMDAQTGEPYETARLSMLENLSASGFVEGKNLEITHHIIGNDVEKAKQILIEELEKPYDVFFIQGSITATAANEVILGENKDKYKHQNIVFASVTDPVGIGIIDDFKNPPKANITGICYPVPVDSRLRFIRELMPEAKTFGLVYADMPQSHSYKKWIEDILENDPEFKDINVIFRSVTLVKGDDGSQKMAELSRPIIKELDSQVDVFLAPNDQMGVQEFFPKMVSQEATKPLCGIGKNDVMKQWGATMTMFPSNISVGKQAAAMIAKLFNNTDLKEIIPEWPQENGVAFDLDKIEEFGITIPINLIKLAEENFVGISK